MDRRAFLRRSSLALAGGLLVGDAVMDAYERLTHRRVFALGGLPHGNGCFCASCMTALYKKTNADVLDAMKVFTDEWSWVEDDVRPRSLFAPPVQFNARYSFAVRTDVPGAWTLA